MHKNTDDISLNNNFNDDILNTEKKTAVFRADGTGCKGRKRKTKEKFQYRH